MATSTAVRRRNRSRKRTRLAVIAGLGAVLASAGVLVSVALRDQIVFFYSPGDLVERPIEPGTAIRLGGLVKEGSWVREADHGTFTITDGVADLKATYAGMLPDLFREGQGVVAEGEILPDGSFQATNVLAKHDENYMPKEVVDALKQSGEWQHGDADRSGGPPLGQ
jgi:cytochrome c-type biogenesis protein CcmE